MTRGVMKFFKNWKRPGNGQKKEPVAGHDAAANGDAQVGSGKSQAASTTTSDKACVVLPRLREAPLAERADLFRKKLQVCSQIFDFYDDSNQRQREKEAKRQTLLDIVEYVNNTHNCFNESLMQDVVSMVGANIFRALQTKDRFVMPISDPENDEPMLERAWPHLQLVYEFFLRFVVSNDVDPKIAKSFVDQNFVLKLLELFDSEDPRERNYLKNILHRVYGKFMALRPFIRRAIQHVFFKVIYECEMHNGIRELLEILGSIINGFAIPLKEEHKDFLIKALIPLHKVNSLASFHPELSWCMTQYVEKDPRLSYDIITSMIKFWPVSTSKQVLFLNELEEILELTRPAEFHQMQEQLFRRIGMCIKCPNLQVAERTFILWNNDYIVELINQNRQALFPIIIEALYTDSKQHWNSVVHGLTVNDVLKHLMEADPQLFDECSAKQRQDAEEEEQREQVRRQKWAFLQEQAGLKKRS